MQWMDFSGYGQDKLLCRDRSANIICLILRNDTLDIFGLFVCILTIRFSPNPGQNSWDTNCLDCAMTWTSLPQFNPIGFRYLSGFIISRRPNHVLSILNSHPIFQFYLCPVFQRDRSQNRRTIEQSYPRDFMGDRLDRVELFRPMGYQSLVF
jgi:hypothetical protein